MTTSRVFGAVQLQSGRVSAPFHNLRQEMDSPQHTEGQAAVEMVDFPGESAQQKGKVDVSTMDVNEPHFFWR